ncbi:reverse transcriptase domain-containing protein [Tanacetum coccineum]|uniref:Reverse transcriptase domain-containing protein n=1 Tax=Tanacetum coccineum TaxID=301880 RepID=A0ABQ5HIW8_9ASTR
MAILMVQPWQRVARQRVTQNFSPDLEISFPPLGDEDKAEGPMIIEADIGGHFIHRIYRRNHMANGINIATSKNRGCGTSTSTWMNFVVVRSPSPYNKIIGRPGVRKIQAVLSTAHGMLKLLVSGGILTLRSSKIIPLECTMVSGSEAQPSAITRASEERIKVAIHPVYLEQTISIADMTGVPPHITEHRLNVREGFPPVKQKKKSQAQERNKAIQEEVEKLVDAGIMKKVHYHSWPRISVKGKILAEFIVERPEDDSPAAPMEVEEELLEPWTLFTNGSSCIDGSGAGLINTNPEGIEFTYALRFKFDATNNEAEYEALIVGLRIA